MGDSDTEGFGRSFADELEDIGPEELRLNAQDHAFMEQAAQREQAADDHPILKLVFQGSVGFILLAAGAVWVGLMAVIVVGLIELAQRV